MHPSQVYPFKPSFSNYKTNLAFHAFAIILIAGLYAGFNAWIERGNQSYPLDIDGWGHLINRLENIGHNFTLLFQEPSLQRGPFVPFIFGLCYYIAPFAESVLIFNTIAFSLAA